MNQKEIIEKILDKVQDCLYGMNINVGGEEYKRVLGEIKNSTWLKKEIEQILYPKR